MLAGLSERRTVDFIPSPTAIPVSGGAADSPWTLPFLIISGVAVLATVTLFLLWNRERT